MSYLSFLFWLLFIWGLQRISAWVAAYQVWWGRHVRNWMVYLWNWGQRNISYMTIHRVNLLHLGHVTLERELEAIVADWFWHWSHFRSNSLQHRILKECSLVNHILLDIVGRVHSNASYWHSMILKWHIWDAANIGRPNGCDPMALLIPHPLESQLLYLGPNFLLLEHSLQPINNFFNLN